MTRPRRYLRKPAAALLLAILSCGHGVARAEHPMLTEDTGTQGQRRFELEQGFAFTQGDPSFGGKGREYGPQLSYGVAPALDVIVHGTWLSQSPPGAPTVRGIGDTTVDGKWRLPEAGPLTFAVRAGIDVPTGDDGKGLGAGSTGFHVVGIAGREFASVSVFANAAYARVRQPGARNSIGAFSIAAIGPTDAVLRTFVEAAAYSNPDPGNPQWPALARTGLLYTLREGVVFDVGYQARLNASAPRHVLLAGATLRW